MAALAAYATKHTVLREGGVDRYQTAALVSAATFAPGVPVAYIADGATFPDALTGAAAAGTLRGPVLLTGPSGPLNAYTAAELARLKPQRIIVLGGPASISDGVLAQLQSLLPV